MQSSLNSVVVGLGLFLLWVPSPGSAADGPDRETGTVVETNEVKRATHKTAKHKSLRFLRDNRVFIRAQLDRLRLQTTLIRTDDAQSLDERYLRLKEMSDAIAAARDTIRAGQALASERELLASVTELAELQNELALMEALLADQRQRLLLLEEDFLGHQQTALVVVVKGLTGKDAPAVIVFAEDNEIVRVNLNAEQRASLKSGGIAQIYHEFVEPREHIYQVSFSGESWSETSALTVPVEAMRNRLTFLELNLTRLDRDVNALGLETSVWYR